MSALKRAVLYSVATLCVDLPLGVVRIRPDEMRRYVLALLLVATARAMPALEKDGDPGLMSSVLGVVKECVEGDVSLCLKVKKTSEVM